MDFTHVTASVEGAWLAALYQDTQTYIVAERDRERVFRGSSLNNHQSSRIDC